MTTPLAMVSVTPAGERIKARRVLPGFGLAMGTTLTYLGVIALLPLAALLLKSAEIGPARLLDIITSPRTLAAFGVTAGAAVLATLFNAAYGLLMAEVAQRRDVKLTFWEYTKPGFIITIISLILGVMWIEMFIWK